MTQTQPQPRSQAESVSEAQTPAESLVEGPNAADGQSAGTGTATDTEAATQPPVDHPTPPTYQQIEAFGYQRFTNREQSRLDFGSRLLDLAEDDGQPLLERAKFLAIFSELLDEFYQIRVAALEDQVAAGVRTRSVDGLRPGEQLTMIRGRVEELVRRQDHIFLDRIVPALADAGIRLSSWSSLDDEDREYLVEVFRCEIYPVLTPLAVDPGHPFPYISNLSLNLVVEVQDPVAGERRIARVKVPPTMDRFVVMPDGERFVPLEQVIAAHLDWLFPGMIIGHHHAFRVTRNADLALEEDEADDLLVAIEMELRRRRFGKALRLEVEDDTGQDLVDLLATELEVGPDGVFRVGAPIDLSGLWGVYALDRPDLHGETWTPMTSPRLAQVAHEPAEFFAMLRERDVLVHHPYDSFATSVEAFVAQAAEDPAVLGIKQTLYRTGGDSPIVQALIAAAENGKQVAAIVELKARFDEEANIGWARALEEVGVHVVYGIVGLKTHSKTALVLRREDDGVRSYCHVGTGNYNSKTARIYEDLGLLTSDPAIGADVGELFNYLTGFSRHADYRQILVSPVTVRKRIHAMIEEQAEAGPSGRIVMKLNGLTDADMIDALYRASGAGVQIDLAVRGLCRLRPGIPELSENIRVRSIVGSFLEHSRIYRFGGAPADAAAGPGLPLKIYIGSADLMGRNLDRRIEVVVPVHDPELQARLFEVLDLVFADETNAWELGSDRRWRRVQNRHGVSSQEKLKELARERARRRLDTELRVGEGDEARPPA
ncbi:MAG TPA: polyphosphate kinase 1 [Acidimicrobiales bacterium]|nr:polyphosphate kinase 1 [Acidimicrobiales bacterium]